MAFRPDRVYTLADLEGWSAARPTLAVLGDPVAHSLSPPMHRAALAQMRESHPEFADWAYVRFQVAADDLVAALPRFHAAGFRGLNLTIPHKVVALPACQAVEPEAAEMGAVNTLTAMADGLHGANTDGFGLQRAVETALGRGLAGANVWLVGAGGAARAVAVQALRQGAARLWIANRSRPRLDELLGLMQPLAGETDLRGFLLAEAPWSALEAPLVVNVTPSGLNPTDVPPLPPADLAAGAAIYDSTYGPPNALARAAQAAGLPYADGLAMLVWQGWASLQRWTGQKPDAAAMFGALRDGA